MKKIHFLRPTSTLVIENKEERTLCGRKEGIIWNGNLDMLDWDELCKKCLAMWDKMKV